VPAAALLHCVPESPNRVVKEDRIEFTLPRRVPSLPAACLMPVAKRWLAALPSCALGTLYVAYVLLVHDAVVPQMSIG